MDLYQSIVEAVCDVFSTMLMIDATAGAAVSESNTVQGGVSGMLGFSGDVSGMVSLHCPEPVALGITTSFLGMDVQEINEDVKDAVGELVNMVTGGLKEALSKEGRNISLAIPTTIAGRSFRIAASSADNMVCVPFTLSEGDFLVEVKIKQAA